MTLAETRRSGHEVIIKPGIRPQRRQRIAVVALFAPTWEKAAEMVLEEFKDD